MIWREWKLAFCRLRLNRNVSLAKKLEKSLTALRISKKAFTPKSSRKLTGSATDFQSHTFLEFSTSEESFPLSREFSVRLCSSSKLFFRVNDSNKITSAKEKLREKTSRVGKRNLQPPLELYVHFKRNHAFSICREFFILLLDLQPGVCRSGNFEKDFFCSWTRGKRQKREKKEQKGFFFRSVCLSFVLLIRKPNLPRLSIAG